MYETTPVSTVSRTSSENPGTVGRDGPTRHRVTPMGDDEGVSDGRAPDRISYLQGTGDDYVIQPADLGTKWQSARSCLGELRARRRISEWNGRTSDS